MHKNAYTFVFYVAKQIILLVARSRTKKSKRRERLSQSIASRQALFIESFR